MDIPTLALAKAYTDSQRLAYADGWSIKSDGITEGKPTVDIVGDGSMLLYKVSDIVLSVDSINGATATTKNLVDGDINTYTITDATEPVPGVVLALQGMILSAVAGDYGIVIPESGTYFTINYDGISYSVVTMQRETIHPVDPKYIPAMDSVTLNSPNGTQFKITVDDTGALTTTEVTT